jgi:polyferredoxin
MVRLLAIFSVLYFGFYRLGCVCSVGSIQNVALALGDPSYALPLTVGAFFALPLAFALFCGRMFCAAACPLGAIQDLVVMKPRQVSPIVTHSLGLIPYLYLGVGVAFAWTGTGFIVCQYDPFIPFYRLGGPWGIIAFGAALLVIATVIGRPYCRFLCPYGVLLRWASALARWRIRITPGECLHCHLCADECPFGAIHPPTVFEPPFDRTRMRRRLTLALACLPTLVAALAWLGHLSAPVVARMHRDVALAERLWMEERGRVRGTTDETDAYRQLALPNSEAYRRAVVARKRIGVSLALLGAWFGLVIGGKTVMLALRRKREDYEADRGGCVSCARCYLSCPVEHERLGLITLE